VNVLTFLVVLVEVVEVRLVGMGFEQIESFAAEKIAAGAQQQVSFKQMLLDPPVEFLNVVQKLALAILGLALLRGIFTFSTRVAMANLSERVIWRLRSMLFVSLQQQSFSYYDRNFSGELINRVTGDVQRVRQMINLAWFATLRTMAYIIGYFILMLTIDPILALVAMATVPICIGQLIRLANKLRSAFHNARDSEDDMITALQENIAGAEVVKAFARERAESSKFGKLSEILFGRIMSVVDLFRFNMPLYRALVRLNLVLVLGVGGAMVMADRMATGGQATAAAGDRLLVADLVVFSMAVNIIGNHLREVLHVSNLVQEALASSERIFEILDAQADVEEQPDAQPLPEGNGQVLFDHVSFGYDKDERVLHDINLDIQAGEVIAVVGPTGSGKTTLLNLLPRFYDPDEGQVLIDGMSVREAKLESVRQSIGLVFQETFLFSDTVANNIAFGVPDVSREEVVTAARIARAHGFIEQLSDGYETVIGERGVTLSGGQQQRLAIARAIVKNPRILILDDAMAAVDSATEHEITSDLDEVFVNRTVFIVAHRLSSVKRADRVIVIEDGRITAIGAHDELMRTEGHYRQMARLQLGEALEGEADFL
jgi:ATP-binding cassette subfamily B protein